MLWKLKIDNFTKSLVWFFNVSMLKKHFLNQIKLNAIFYHFIDKILTNLNTIYKMHIKAKEIN